MKKPNLNTKQVTSAYKQARISPRKVVAVANEIRGKGVEEARHFLRFCDKKAAGIVLGVVNSAVANAVYNEKMDKDSLIIEDVRLGPGTTLKRGRWAARGKFKPIMKRTSNITIVLKGGTSE